MKTRRAFRPPLMLLLLIVAAAASANKFLVSEKAYRVLSKAEQAMQERQYSQALEVIDAQLAKQRGFNDYERALLERLAGNALIGMDDYARAMRRFESVATTAALPAAVQTQVGYTLAQLYLYAERYRDALNLLRQNMRGDAAPSAAVCFLMASAHLGLEQFADALIWGERGLTRAADERPEEPHWALVANLNLQLGHYSRAAELLEQLVDLYPDTEQHWRQLSAVYAELERPAQALAVAELGYLRGTLTADADLERLAKLYLRQALPYKAAVLLEQAGHAAGAAYDADRYRLLADAWIGAREYARAVEPLERAVKLLRRSDQADEEARIRLRKGIVHAYLEQPRQAAREFNYCLKFDTTKDAAGKWLDYLQAAQGTL